MARTDPTIYMRLPPELKSRLDAAAMANHCSLTSEVVRRLEASFASEGVSRHPALAAQVALPLESPEEHKAQLLTELEALHQEARSIRNQIAADPVHNGWRSRHEKARSSADVIDAFWRVFDYPTPLRHENLATPICGVETDTTVIVDEAERLPMLAYVPGGSRDDLVKVSRSNAVIYGEKGGT